MSAAPNNPALSPLSGALGPIQAPNASPAQIAQRAKYLKPPWTERPPGAGAKKGKSVTAELKRLMEEGGLTGEGLATAMAEIAYKEAMKGNIKFWNTIVERLEGATPQRIEVTCMKAIDPALYEQV